MDLHTQLLFEVYQRPITKLCVIQINVQSSKNYQSIKPYSSKILNETKMNVNMSLSFPSELEIALTFANLIRLHHDNILPAELKVITILLFDLFPDLI